MPRLLSALVFVLPLAAFAQQTPLDFYGGLAGHWTDDSGTDISYTVGSSLVRVSGEICSPTGKLPSVCYPVEQSYEPEANVLFHDSAFGRQPVKIVELTDNKIVRSESHPLKDGQIVVTTEQLDGSVLRITSEIWQSGQAAPESHVEAMLHRRDDI